MTDTLPPHTHDLIAWVEGALRTALHPTILEVVDESHKHAGHAGRIGVAEGQVTHLRLRLQAEALRGLSRVAAHRMIHDALQPAFAAGLHALAIEMVRG